MQPIQYLIAPIVLATVLCSTAAAADQPNIIVVFADDISARELPIYGSSVWSPPLRGNTSDPELRAATPTLDRLANEGCWIKTAWASVVCSPSRAMMMTGRYAHLHKWWGNKSKGRYIDERGKESTWPLYLSSPRQIGHIAQQAGYKTYWAGKTQMAGDLRRFGFDQGCFTPGNLADKDNPFTDFKLVFKNRDSGKVLLNADTNQPVNTYQQHGWYWYPHVRLMNHDGQDFQWWPNTKASKSKFGVGTYGPDVELDFIFDFMEQQVAADKPFFVYHTSHLGHDAFDWLDPDSESSWPGTPVVKWDGQKYTRTQPYITGDAGKYETNGTVTRPGIHHHINYLDYQTWLYQNKLEELGISNNTIFVFCADNGTSGYGKNSTDRQKGTHVPLIISAPGMTKRGEQDVLVNMCDFLPTIAELTGAELTADYEINGESLVPFLFGDRQQHRDWLYGYKDKEQIIRGTKVMRDGRGKWWDVESTPDDLISFPQIQDWKTVSAAHREERDKLLAVLPGFDQQKHGKHAPGSNIATTANPESPQRARGNGSTNQSWTVTFKDDYEKRDELGQHYTTARGHDDSWSVKDGVLVGKQTKDDHGAVIRTELDFDDVDFQFDFRFRGGRSFNFVIDDANEKSVHAGHICRASIFPTHLTVGDDKTGAMNLEIRRQRQDKSLSPENAAALRKLLERTRSSAKVDIRPNTWHTLRIRIRGDVMKAFLDEELITSLKSPGFAHPTKTKFGFTVNGQSIEFDNLTLRQLKPRKPLGGSPRAADEPPVAKPQATNAAGSTNATRPTRSGSLSAKPNERKTAAQLLSPGETVAMTAPGKHSVTYHVAMPRDYEADASPRPLLVVFSPGGNGRGLLDKLRVPADSSGWVLVGCDKLRNGLKSRTTAVEMEDEVLDDIFKNIPHDRQRVYLGGFSGGAMRAYGITARRSEPYAGVVAFGGWLGGPGYQDKPYRKNMSVAMLTGTRDLGASGWVPIDTRTLKKRNCTVKHFGFPGGHTVAPAEMTGLAMHWLDSQWNSRKKEGASTSNRIALDLLYVGTDDARTKDFTSFLSGHFRSVSATKPADLTLAMANRADVLVLDAVVRSLPDGYTKAMLMTGSSAALIGERYGSKIDWLCQCLDNEAYAVDTSHPVFRGPLPVAASLVEKRCPHTKMKIQAWKVEELQEDPGLVSSRKHFAFAKDSEIISGGVNMKGISGVPLVREANRFLWGFVASPKQMTEEGRRVFVNALSWIHQFDGELQTEFAGLHTRDKIKSVLDSPYVNAGNLNRWFEQKLIDQTNADKEAIRKYFDGKLDYVHVPRGSGLLQIDQEALQLETPIDDPASIARWIGMLDGNQSKLAFGLLRRYTRQRIRRKPQQWRQWYQSNKEKLVFSEQAGYRFTVREQEAVSQAAKKAFRNQARGQELTEISPVLFEQGLAALHVVDGVAYQYAGWKVTLVIRARVKEGWHFYSTNNDNGTNTPTELDIELPDGMEFVGPWKYPESSDGTLGDGAVFERVIRLGKNPIDIAEIQGRIRFQACTQQRCLSPQTAEFSLPIKAMAK